MTCSLALSTPTIQCSTILCHFQCNHMLGFIKLKISTKESQKKKKKKEAKEKLASGGEDETKKKSKMLALVIWKLVTCLGSYDEGCLLWGLISSFLNFSFFFVVFFFLCFFFFFFVFLFLFFSLSFGSFIFLPFIWF